MSNRREAELLPRMVLISKPSGSAAIKKKNRHGPVEPFVHNRHKKDMLEK